ncbi:MAG TPA: hypothetical protein VJ844_02465 [Mucilaginibacter sp.]|nr:hypothetical protein [Mucilaginibacter sp.]
MQKLLNIKMDYLLIAASIFLLVLTYQFAFKKTIDAWQLHTSLKKEITQSTDAGYQPGYLERKNANLDKILTAYDVDTNNYRNNILSRISSIAEQQHVKLFEAPLENPLYRTSQLVIQRIDFEGDYFSLEKTLNKLETTKDIGVIRSVAIKLRGANSPGVGKKVNMEIYIKNTINQ